MRATTVVLNGISGTCLADNIAVKVQEVGRNFGTHSRQSTLAAAPNLPTVESGFKKKRWTESTVDSDHGRLSTCVFSGSGRLVFESRLQIFPRRTNYRIFG